LAAADGFPLHHKAAYSLLIAIKINFCLSSIRIL